MSGQFLKNGAVADATASVKPESPEGKPTVTVLDYGSGNVRSAVRALERAGAHVVLSSKPEDVLNADGLVVPGVGAYETVMKELKSVDAIRMIGRRVAGGRPVLAICVGLQVLFEAGVEHGTESEGMAEWPGKVELLPAPVVPHMGWNTVDVPEAQSCSPALSRNVSTLCTPTVSRSGTSTSFSPAWLLPWSRVRAWCAFHCCCRERPTLRYPIPPGEVRRCRSPAPAKLGGQPP